MKVKTKLLALLLTALLLCGCAAGEETAAEPAAETPKPTVSIPSPPPPAEKREYEEAMVFFEGLLGGRAYVKDSVLYISPESLAEHYGFQLRAELREDGFSLIAPELDMSGSYNADYMEANGRYIYSPGRSLIVGGRLYLPEDVTEKVFGVNVTVFGEPVRAEISDAAPRFIEGGSNYYDISFDTLDIYWLTQIIYAEARDEPMAGLIGVGNVVLSRVESELYPDTVFDVIFEREPAVQFDPVFTGGIHEQADERSYIAACLCLEGYNTVGESLFFVNPVKGDATWVSENREFVCSIGRHDFYA